MEHDKYKLDQYRKDLIDAEKGQQIVLNKAYEFSSYKPIDILI